MTSSGSDGGRAPRAPRVLRVRWLVFVWIFAAAFIAYLQRTTLAVVAVPLTREAGFTTWQISWLFNAFLIAYTAFQVPGGLFGQRVGARRGTLACILLSVAGTAGFAFAPALATGTSLLALLAAARFITGVAQGPLFPINAGLVQAWFPPRRWALMNGLQVTGLSLGAAATQPIVSRLMSDHGWQAAVYATCVPGLALAAVWWWYVRDTPREHPAVLHAELTEIEGGEQPARARQFDWAAAGRVLADRNVLLLTLGYLLMNYVFYFFMNWSFTYLVEARKLTILQSGWLAAIPLVTGALCASLGGYLCDLACLRIGARWGFRIVPLVTLPLAAVLLSVAMRTESAYWAVAALAGCFGCAQMTEAPFWAAAFWVARDQASAATGVLNTGGNVGGIIGTFLVGYLASRYGWGAAFATGIGFALASGALWLLIDAERRVPARR
ncbi:MAG TPA: MFS transporter [Steroidobacteraceae bacterium]|nr:MFS transporter [Steroidobacteraceae bacterium]